jgi:hypothetical protein
MHYTFFLKMWKLSVQELAILHENWCWMGKGIIRLGLQLVNEFLKKLVEKKRSIVYNNQEKGNYNQET